MIEIDYYYRDVFCYKINSLEQGLEILKQTKKDNCDNMNILFTFVEIYLCGIYAFGFSEYSNVDSNSFYFASSVEEDNLILSSFCYDGTPLIDVEITAIKDIESAIKEMSSKVKEFKSYFKDEKDMENKLKELTNNYKNKKYEGNYLTLLKNI